MAETIKTGGRMKFVRSGEDDERVRAQDTAPTAEFKEGYRRWQDRRARQKAMAARRNKLLLYIVIAVLAIIGALAFFFLVLYG